MSSVTRHRRRWLLAVAAAAATAWLYVLGSTAAQLRALFEPVAAVPVFRAPGRQRTVASARTSIELEAPLESRRPELPARPAAGDAGAEEIMRLLAGELAATTDRDAADELLRAFEESLDDRR